MRWAFREFYKKRNIQTANLELERGVLNKTLRVYGDNSDRNYNAMQQFTMQLNNKIL